MAGLRRTRPTRRGGAGPPGVRRLRLAGLRRDRRPGPTGVRHGGRLAERGAGLGAEPCGAAPDTHARRSGRRFDAVRGDTRQVRRPRARHGRLPRHRGFDGPRRLRHSAAHDRHGQPLGEPPRQAHAPRRLRGPRQGYGSLPVDRYRLRRPGRVRLSGHVPPRLVAAGFLRRSPAATPCLGPFPGRAPGTRPRQRTAGPPLHARHRAPLDARRRGPPRPDAARVRHRPVGVRCRAAPAEFSTLGAAAPSGRSHRDRLRDDLPDAAGTHRPGVRRGPYGLAVRVLRSPARVRRPCDTAHARHPPRRHTAPAHAEPSSRRARTPRFSAAPHA